MNLFLFLTLSSMFLSSVFMGTISFVLLNAERPWEVDLESNLLKLTGVENGTEQDFDDWFAAAPDPELLRTFMLAMYKFSALTMLSYCSFALAVLFVAYKNIPLVFWTQVTTASGCGLVAYCLQDLYEVSRHTRLFVTVAALSLIGFLSYGIFIMQTLRQKKGAAACPPSKSD